MNTVIIFLARNGRIRAVEFRPQNFGRISFDLGEISTNQQIFRLNNGRNLPKSAENLSEIFGGEPQLHIHPVRPKNISTVNMPCLM
jgi:hypothetical protein